jgi:PsbP-like protein
MLNIKSKIDSQPNNKIPKIFSWALLTMTTITTLTLIIPSSLIIHNGLDNAVYAQEASSRDTSVTYLNPKVGIRVDYPSSWKALEIQGDPMLNKTGSIVTFIPPSSNASQGNFQDNMLISVSKLSSRNMTLSAYTSDSLNAYRNQPNIEILENSPTTLSGMPAHKTVFSEDFQGNNLTKLQIWAVADGKAYIVTFGADSSEFADHLSDAETIVSSINITPASSSSTLTPTPTPSTPISLRPPLFS